MDIHANSRRPLVLLLFLLSASALIVSGCGDDDDPTDPGGGNNGDSFEVSAEMQGVWTISTTYTDCDGNPIDNPAFQDYTYTDTLCIADANVVDMMDDPACSITNNSSSSFTMDCSYNESIPGVDCNIGGTTSVSFSWTSTTMTANGTIDITASGSECSQYGQSSVCMLMNISGTRTGDAPAGACSSMSSRFDVAGEIMERLRR